MAGDRITNLKGQGKRAALRPNLDLKAMTLPAILSKLSLFDMSSFPKKGPTLAVDFRRSELTIALIRRLDERDVVAGGRVYLAKDALMTQQAFKASYPHWQSFEATREKYFDAGVFPSAQTLRLGLS